MIEHDAASDDALEPNLKAAWKTQAAPRRVTLDAALVLNEVHRNERQFAASIYWRDVREVGVALLLVPVWIYLGITRSHLWSWYLVIPALLWIAGFMLVDRRLQRRREPGPGETLHGSIRTSLAQVEHQIWLLRHVFWWYLLPLFVGLMAEPIHEAWLTRHEPSSALAGLAWETFVSALVVWFVHWLNQYAVRTDLEPRRDELQSLLRSLDDDGERVEH